MRKSLKREYTIDRNYDFEDRNSQYAKKRAHKRERKRVKFLLIHQSDSQRVVIET